MNPEEIIANLINHSHVRLTNRGNSAILHGIRIAKACSNKKYILIPDQGGWLSYKKYPLKENLKVKELQTDLGLVDYSNLDLDNCAALLISQPAGYFANQDLKQIYQKCKNKCLLIVDVSGSVGDKELCNGKFADIMLGSFGEWKPINLDYGGFISFQNKKLADLSNKIPLQEFDKKYEKSLKKKLRLLDKKYKLFYKTASIIKTELKSFDILHKNKKGINVIVRFNNEEEKQKIIEYCNKKGLPYTECPRYIRVNDNAISIEVKRL